MQERICRLFNLKGKVRIAFEGLNATLEGCRCEVDAYKATLTKLELFSKISPSDFKESSGDGSSFDGLSVAVCDELCTMGISPSKLSHKEGGRYLSPEQFHEALKLRERMMENGDKKVCIAYNAFATIGKCCGCYCTLNFLFAHKHY